MAIIGDVLFLSGYQRPDLSDVLRHNLQKRVPAEVERLSQTEFEAKSDEELIAAVGGRCRVDPLVLKFDEAKGGAQPMQVTVRDVFGDTVTIPGLRITKTIQFAGDAQLFELRPNRYDSGPPHGEVRGNLVIVGMEVRESDSEQAIRHIDDAISQIHKYIAWQVPMIEEYNTALAGASAAAIQRRRASFDKASEIARRLSGG